MSNTLLFFSKNEKKIHCLLHLIIPAFVLPFRINILFCLTHSLLFFVCVSLFLSLCIVSCAYLSTFFSLINATVIFSYFIHSMLYGKIGGRLFCTEQNGVEFKWFSNFEIDFVLLNVYMYGCTWFMDIHLLFYTLKILILSDCFVVMVLEVDDVLIFSIFFSVNAICFFGAQIHASIHSIFINW